jgi:small GTP-binding protein
MTRNSLVMLDPTTSVYIEDQTTRNFYRMNKSHEPKRTIKCMLLGRSHVGKTSVLSCYLNGQHFCAIEPTVQQDRKMKSYARKDYELEIIDTPGDEKLRSHSEIFYKSTEIFILVYDVASMDSLKHLESFYNKILDLSRGSDIIFVGNKLELSDRSDAVTHDYFLEFLSTLKNIEAHQTFHVRVSCMQYWGFDQLEKKIMQICEHRCKMMMMRSQTLTKRQSVLKKTNDGKCCKI